MSRWKLWLALAGAVIAALFGVRTIYERRLDRERERTVDAYKQALDSGDAEGAARAAADVARIESELASQRAAPTSERVAAALAEARRRRSGGAAG